MITWYISYCCLTYCRDTMSSECNLSPIFVYGTLKQGQPNHYLLSNHAGTQPCFLGKALTTDHWPLVIGSPYHIPFLLDRRGTGKRVFGELYMVDAMLLKTLDDLEGHPYYYTRVSIFVKLLDPCASSGVNMLSSCNDYSLVPESRTIACETYILFNFKKDLLNLEYLEDYTDSLSRPYVPCKDRPTDGPSGYSLVKDIEI